jgi:hypothetical protein
MALLGLHTLVDVLVSSTNHIEYIALHLHRAAVLDDSSTAMN